MSRVTHAGSRIRARRISAGLRQAALAQSVGISASYLNLIEHNRRRIGGALLTRLADALDVAPDVLAQGALPALIDRLQVAAAKADRAEPELSHVDDFTARFPGWAELVAEQTTRVSELEHALARLSDQMTHDPHLAASLHDLLSTITSIRSTAAILAEDKDITPEWRARFDRNIHEDSRRLADSSQSLVTYLDEAGDVDHDPALSPTDAVERVFEQHMYHFAAIEAGALAEDVVRALDPPLNSEAYPVALEWLGRVKRDAEALPLAQVRAAVAQVGLDVAKLVPMLGAPVDVVLRRIAHLPQDMLPSAVGLVICDAAGALIHRRAVPDFPLPRYEAGCPFWPMFEALSHPGIPVMRPVRMMQGEERSFNTYSFAAPVGSVGFDRPPGFEAVMLIVPVTGPATGDVPEVTEVGSTCRVCTHQTCAARRVPSLVDRAGTTAAQVF